LGRIPNGLGRSPNGLGHAPTGSGRAPNQKGRTLFPKNGRFSLKKDGFIPAGGEINSAGFVKQGHDVSGN
jgi:hypothetical protein